MKNLVPRNQIVALKPFALTTKKTATFYTTPLKLLTILLLFCTSITSGQIINWTVANGAPYTISSGGPYTLKSLIVEDGGVATISNVTINVEYGGGNWEMQVNKGGELKLINCTLKVNAGSTYWDGIGLDGDVSAKQYSTYPIDPSFSYNGTTGNLYKGFGKQSYLEMTNCVVSGMYLGIVAQSGSILSISGSTFKDNLLNIDIQQYINPDQSQPNWQYYNACNINNCNFQWTVDANGGAFGSNNWANYKFIKMTEVSGVHIQGCSFTNTTTGSLTNDCPDRGTAIYGAGASFSVHKSGTPTVDADGCTSYPGPACSFTGTSYGINAIGTLAVPDYTVAVSKSLFDRHYKAINIFQGARHTISENTFSSASSATYPPSGCGDDIKFIEIGGADNVVINKNVLDYTKIGVGVTTAVTGANLIDCYSLGANNSLIYNNTLTALTGSSALYPKNFFGMHFSGDNTGVLVQCNTFLDMRYDIYNDGDIHEMGSATVAAGNVFSANAVKNIANIGSTIIYNFASGANKKPTGPFVTLIGPVASEGCPDLNCHGWPVGINKVESNETPNLYPNPVNNMLNISFKLANALYTIYDTEGRIVYKQMSKSDLQQIDVSNWPEGLYYIQTNANTGIGKRFVVAH